MPDYVQMWKDLGMDLESHDTLCQVLPTAVGDGRAADEASGGYCTLEGRDRCFCKEGRRIHRQRNHTRKAERGDQAGQRKA